MSVYCFFLHAFFPQMESDIRTQKEMLFSISFEMKGVQAMEASSATRESHYFVLALPRHRH